MANYYGSFFITGLIRLLVRHLLPLTKASNVELPDNVKSLAELDKYCQYYVIIICCIVSVHLFLNKRIEVYK